MEFRFETQYTAKTMAVMAKALRKTVRKKHSRRSHIFGWFVIVLAVLLALSGGFTLDFRTILTAVVVGILLAVLLFEDKLNGWIAGKRLLPGTETSRSVFTEDGFVSETEVGRTEWNYNKILVIAETADFFVFLFSASHAQLYDKRTLTGGSAEDFRRFLESATGKTIQTVR